jgi:hypothetical protein
MKNLSLQQRQNLPFIFLILILFLIEFLPFVMYGMSIDGLLYSHLALNMAQGLGSLWDPFYSDAIWPHFYEHPPLAFYLQSWFFRFLGDSVFVDKFYFFTVNLLNLFLFVLFWRQNNRTVKFHFLWIPIFCFLIGPFQVSNSGYLEYTLCVFTTLATYLIVRALLEKKHEKIYFLLGAILIGSAFFVNGLQALFPIIVPASYALIFSRQNFFKSLIQVVLLFTLVAFFIGFIFWISPKAFENISYYFQTQLLATFSGTRKDFGYHSGLLGHLYGLSQLWPLLWTFIVITIITLFIYAKQKKQNFRVVTKNLLKDKWMIFFFLVALSSFLPILLSPRQALHYFVPSLPFFGLAFARILTPIFFEWISLINTSCRTYKLVLIVLVFGTISALIVMFFSFGKINYLKNADFQKPIQDAILISKNIPPYTAIFTDDPAIISDSYYIILLGRYAYLRVYFAASPKDYYIQTKNQFTHPVGYESVDIGLQKFSLFKKKLNSQ